MNNNVSLIDLKDIWSCDFFNVLELLKVADYYYKYMDSSTNPARFRINVQPVGGEAREITIPQEAALHVLNYMIQYGITYLEELQEDCGITLDKINGRGA